MPPHDRPAVQYLPVELDIVVDHAGGGKALLEDLAAAGATEQGHPFDRLHGLFNALHHPPGDAILEHFGHRPAG